MNILDLLAIALIFSVPLDLYTTWRIVSETIRRPHISYLTAFALFVSNTLIIAGATALLAFNRLAFMFNGKMPLPPDVSTGLLIFILLVPSLPNIYLLRLLRRSQPSPRRRHYDP